MSSTFPSPRRLGFVGAVPVDMDATRDVIDKYVHVPAQGEGTNVEVVLDHVLESLQETTRQIQLIEVIPNANITVNVGNYFTLSVIDRGSNGQGDTVLATLAFSAGGPYDAWVPFTLPLVASAAGPSPNDVLTLQITHAGSGQVVPDLAVRIRYKN